MAVLTIGPIGNDAAKAIAEVETETGMSVAHYDMRFLKPLDEDILKEVGEKFNRIITIEDGVRMGGMGSAVLEWMNDHDYQPRHHPNGNTRYLRGTWYCGRTERNRASG